MGDLQSTPLDYSINLSSLCGSLNFLLNQFTLSREPITFQLQRQLNFEIHLNKSIRPAAGRSKHYRWSKYFPEQGEYNLIHPNPSRRNFLASTSHRWFQPKAHNSSEQFLHNCRQFIRNISNSLYPRIGPLIRAELKLLQFVFNTGTKSLTLTLVARWAIIAVIGVVAGTGQLNKAIGTSRTMLRTWNNTQGEALPLA